MKLQRWLASCVALALCQCTASTPSGTEPDAGTPPDSSSDGTSDAVGASECAAIADACSTFGDSLGLWCSQVSADEDAEQCAALEDECLGHCREAGAVEIEPIATGTDACQALGKYCHEGDEGNGLVSLCHTTGHHVDVMRCSAIWDECLEVCDGLTLPEAEATESDAMDAGNAR